MRKQGHCYDCIVRAAVWTRKDSMVFQKPTEAEIKVADIRETADISYKQYVNMQML